MRAKSKEKENLKAAEQLAADASDIQDVNDFVFHMTEAVGILTHHTPNHPPLVRIEETLKALRKFAASCITRGPAKEGDAFEKALQLTELDICVVTDEIAQLLMEKNRAYGNTALNPKRIFSKASVLDMINVRIDDKLSRIANDEKAFNEDAELDLLGYLILRRIARKRVESSPS